MAKMEEDRISGYAQECNRLSRDLELLSNGYKELCEAYHQVGHIIAADRHVTKTHTTCNEQSCEIHRQFLNNILLGEK